MRSTLHWSSSESSSQRKCCNSNGIDKLICTKKSDRQRNVNTMGKELQILTVEYWGSVDASVDKEKNLVIVKWYDNKSVTLISSSYCLIEPATKANETNLRNHLLRSKGHTLWRSTTHSWVGLTLMHALQGTSTTWSPGLLFIYHAQCGKWIVILLSGLQIFWCQKSTEVELSGRICHKPDSSAITKQAPIREQLITTSTTRELDLEVQTMSALTGLHTDL